MGPSSARKATPRNPKIVKIKPGESDTAIKGLTRDESSTRELLSLIPSQRELEGMNLKKFAFLQQRRRNSQMDIQDQRSLGEQRNASVRKILALQEGNASFGEGTTRSGGG